MQFPQGGSAQNLRRQPPLNLPSDLAGIFRCIFAQGGKRVIQRVFGQQYRGLHLFLNQFQIGLVFINGNLRAVAHQFQFKEGKQAPLLSALNMQEPVHGLAHAGPGR
ncbi:MAG: hypothetical protein BWY09_01914 [Candidatus Hydrogenedentes bacterium ADurb.Bin179]|nr:MAG: hypothetical protein BWY09_01914 [Candidatus Hydrogenedentes bacterium ADurb.Bin179]